MAYTKYTHDLFLSYRHLDNKALTSEKEGWIARLHRDLSTRVAQYLGEDVEVWRDCRLQGNEYFSDTIEQTVSGVAALVSVISPGYETGSTKSFAIYDGRRVGAAKKPRR